MRCPVQVPRCWVLCIFLLPSWPTRLWSLSHFKVGPVSLPSNAGPSCLDFSHWMERTSVYCMLTVHKQKLRIALDGLQRTELHWMDWKEQNWTELNWMDCWILVLCRTVCSALAWSHPMLSSFLLGPSNQHTPCHTEMGGSGPVHKNNATCFAQSELFPFSPFPF